MKDIRDGLARAPPGPRGLDRPDNDNDDNDDDNDNDDMPDLETEEEAAERIAKTSGNYKVFGLLDKVKNMKVEMSNLDKMVTDKENKWSTKLNESNNEGKKLDNYIKKITIKKLIQKKN